MQWRKWRLIASLWRLELDTKSGPWRLAILAKIARGLAIMVKTLPAPWKLAILAKMVIVAKLAISAKIATGLVVCRMWQIFKLDAKSGPLKLDN